jgi:hypothetical protein
MAKEMVMCVDCVYDSDMVLCVEAWAMKFEADKVGNVVGCDGGKKR